VDNEGWKPLIGQSVVVDTDSTFVYLGTLARVEEYFVVVENVDCHDRREGPSTKEQYIMDARRFGIKPNRKETQVRKAIIVSVSRLEDILVY
jgi:hypothetical protein